jgi:hypothetical protein
VIKPKAQKELRLLIDLKKDLFDGKLVEGDDNDDNVNNIAYINCYSVLKN